ncbi:MAG TPA: hypothetical protein VIS52_05355, partial [Motiliproteus sp.]
PAALPLLLYLGSLGGCVGVMVDTPSNATIEFPVPLRSAADNDRWSCQPNPLPPQGLSKAEFHRAWGPPQRIESQADGELWLYQEQRRWCGTWVFLLIPFPFALPVCETYDHVQFRSDEAVSAASRRFTRSFAGIVLVPVIPGAMPVLTRGGNKHDSDATVTRFPPNEMLTSCSTPNPPSTIE